VNDVAVDDRPVRTGGLTVGSARGAIITALSAGGVGEPRRVAADIISALLDVPRSWPALHAGSPVDSALLNSALQAARKLVAGAPFAYAVGRASFRHLTLEVDQRVLIPRPETELLVDEILSRFRSKSPGDEDWGVAIDVGTGSGAIALSLAVEGNFSRVVGTDASLDALEVATRNAKRAHNGLRCPVEFRSGTFLAPVADLRPSLIVSNPPYVAFRELGQLPESVRNWEPPTALLGGADGLAATAAIVQEGVTLLKKGGLLALEVDERRASLVAEMTLANAGYIDVGVVLDLTGRERFVFASRA
jgi:release factor glutamine methyltransferase